ncbi:RadC family protein, partial [Thomasclavelia ramosa]
IRVMKLKNYPLEERPREKAFHHGIESLNNIELLALVLRTGNKQESAIELAQRVINEIGGFRYLHDINYYQLIQIKGIKQAKAIEVLAIIEIAKRLDKQPVAMSAIKEPRDGYELLKNQLMFEQQEKVIVLCLNSRLEVIKEKTVFIGGNNISIISGRELFKEALICGSNRVMVVHNHPSGNPEPSIEDIEATERLYSMAKELDIDVVDHLIIGRSRFYSFASNKIIEV